MQNSDVESYVTQVKRWPENGNHILAQFDESTITVYQAFKPSIAQYAVVNQRFGGNDFSFTRMSWIKTNFLWMMYRSGWATKKDQERILAVRIKRQGFDEILRNAFSVKYQKLKGVKTDEIEVRLQWDPDHSPTFEKQSRRAIQLGLKGQILQKYANDWIVNITDITEFVVQQRALKETTELVTPREQTYLVADGEISERINLSSLCE
ncbi:uncharacterized protein LOC141905470 [Tubulanus polymorphus]|uniref:uncharacterized protein LOC141905470 n=1 Tax=Tubulanus polymorphus TaxID=672921 RepID=UPI003DA5DBBE